MVGHSCATLSVAAPALPKAILSFVPCRDVQSICHVAQVNVGPRDEIRLVATLMEDAVLDGLALALLLRRLGERRVDQEAELTASGIP